MPHYIYNVSFFPSRIDPNYHDLVLVKSKCDFFTRLYLLHVVKIHWGVQTICSKPVLSPGKHKVYMESSPSILTEGLSFKDVFTYFTSMQKSLIERMLNWF